MLTRQRQIFSRRGYLWWRRGLVTASRYVSPPPQCVVVCLQEKRLPPHCRDSTYETSFVPPWTSLRYTGDYLSRHLEISTIVSLIVILHLCIIFRLQSLAIEYKKLEDEFRDALKIEERRYQEVTEFISKNKINF
jgi:hypothetical protein